MTGNLHTLRGHTASDQRVAKYRNRRSDLLDSVAE